MPCRADLVIYQGDTYAAMVTVTDGSGQPPDLTGYVPQAQIRDGPADTNAQVIVEITASIVAPNFVSLSIPAAQTVALAGQYVWDLQLQSPDGMVQTILAGYALAQREVTREVVARQRAGRAA